MPTNLARHPKASGLVLAALTGLLVTTPPVAAEDAAQPLPDKRRYNLFNPTPREYLRELNTDRPDKTESPYTVDAGHVQVEMDLVSYTHDRDRSGGGDTRTGAFAIAPVNLKVGLLNNVDFQVVLGTYTHVRMDDRATGTVEKMSGFGDVTTRLKVNFWGNDGGPTALGLMPIVKFPTNQDGLGNKAVEGGVILPFVVALPGKWDMGLMTQANLLRSDADRRYHPSFVNSITFGHNIVGKLGGYVEFFSTVSTERGSRWVGTVDFGLTYGLTENIQLDAGVNIGVTKSADDLNLFVGLSRRF